MNDTKIQQFLGLTVVCEAQTVAHALYGSGRDVSNVVLLLVCDTTQTTIDLGKAGSMTPTSLTVSLFFFCQRISVDERWDYRVLIIFSHSKGLAKTRNILFGS